MYSAKSAETSSVLTVVKVTNDQRMTARGTSGKFPNGPVPTDVP